MNASIKIIRKLRSRRGASISYALLLFMVCAVVGSVVLAAGTAAAGRMSQLTSMDQRYYSVTSAAELLCDTFTGQTLKITQTRTETTVWTTQLTMEGDDTTRGATSPGTPTVVYGFQCAANDGEPTGTFPTGLLWDNAKALVFGNYDTPDAAWELSYPAASSTTTTSLTLTSRNHTELNTNVTMTLRPDGTILLELFNSEGKEKYRLRITLEAHADRSSASKTTTSQPVVRKDDTLTPNPDDGKTYYKEEVTKTRTDTRTTTIFWTVAGIETVEGSAS